MHTIPDADGASHFPPALAASEMKTYRIAAPLRTHWRRASCMEYQCEAFLHGWTTVVDESTPIGERQAHYIRHDKSRRHREFRLDSGLTEFTFEPGQQGFASMVAELDHSRHMVRADVPERYLVLGGDFRGNPRGEYREHANADDWQDDFQTHQDKIADLARRG